LVESEQILFARDYQEILKGDSQERRVYLLVEDFALEEVIYEDWLL